MSIDILRRYTDIPALIHLLKNRKITLLDPTTWDDKNDSYYLSTYKQKRKLASVLVLCFSDTQETYHHWKIFSGNSSGVCIRFNKSLLLNSVCNIKNINHGLVAYRILKDLEKNPLTLPELPFIKRNAYRDECEYRIIYEEKKNIINHMDITIDLKCIHKIVLSPWMPKTIVKSVKEIIRSISGCSQIEIFATSINENRKWKHYGDSVVI